jgi:hypothetical protein
MKVFKSMVPHPGYLVLEVPEEAFPTTNADLLTIAGWKAMVDEKAKTMTDRGVEILAVGEGSTLYKKGDTVMFASYARVQIVEIPTGEKLPKLLWMVRESELLGKLE